MFPTSYFAASYFAPAFWPPGAAAALRPIVIVAPPEGLRKRRRDDQDYRDIHDILQILADILER